MASNKFTPCWDSKSQGIFDADFDCYIAEALLSEGKTVGTEQETKEQYNVSTLAELAKKQQERLKEHPKLESLFWDVEMPLTKILWQMEQTGILLDTKSLSQTGQKIDHLLTQTQTEIAKETGGGINLNSPAQLGDFLVDKVGVPLGKTKTGKYATNEGELSKFADQFPIIAHLLTYRELSKLRSTYVESLIEKVDAQNRIHTTYHQLAVFTGRLASSNPNLQNIPVSSEIGQEIKSCFIASPNHILVSFDYSQQELRILAHLANEKALIHAFHSNQDVHIVTASKIFHEAYENVTKEQRAVGKTINFGIIYGMSSFGMSEGLQIPQSEAGAFIKQFYLSYPNIKLYYDTYLKNAQQTGVVETILGRRKQVFWDSKRRFIDNATRRVLLNYPIQGTAADLMKKAMVEIDKKVLQTNPDVHLLLQIHDDLVFEIPNKAKNRLEQIISQIQEVMCTVYPLIVPVVVDVKLGEKWGSLQKFTREKH